MCRDGESDRGLSDEVMVASYAADDSPLMLSRSVRTIDFFPVPFDPTHFQRVRAPATCYKRRKTGLLDRHSVVGSPENSASKG